MSVPPRGHSQAGAQRRQGPGALAIGASATGVGLLASAAALAVGARTMARSPLVPQRTGRPDVVVRAVHADRLHVDATDETRRPGVLALRQGGGAVHVRLGDVIGEPTPTTVARPILAYDTPAHATIGPASTNGFFWAGDPRTSHALEFSDVAVPSPVGDLPAWLTLGSADADALDGTWAILVHGHGATRGEALRIIPLLHRLGMTSLTVAYRNDLVSPPSADGLYHLGSDEWEDIDAVIAYALARGARRVVLIGWSMGGGIVLRTSVRSRHRDAIAALVLDSPAVDWHSILDHHAVQARAPWPLRALAFRMMAARWGSGALRLDVPLALGEMNAAFYTENLAHRALVIHAGQDATVPLGPSVELGTARPDLIDLEVWPGATHTREWNVDPARYEERVARFLADALDAPELAARLDDRPVRDPASPPQADSTGERL